MTVVVKDPLRHICAGHASLRTANNVSGPLVSQRQLAFELGPSGFVRRNNVMRTITTLCLTVAVSMAVSVAGLTEIRAVVSPAFLLPSNEICGGYLQTIGTIYAVLLAFVVFVVWTQANDVRRLIER
jgi:hypothetical protein